MRVLLINPPYPISETPSPPLSLAVLAAALEQAGIEAAVCDYVVHPYRPVDLEAAIHRFDPQIAGITCVTMTFLDAAKIVRDLKQMAPDVLTVMGGPHVSFAAEKTLRALPALDCVAKGEGENTLVDLARAVAAGADFSHVSGLVWRRDDRIADNGFPRHRVDLRAMAPPARRHLDLGRYRALGLPVSMITSRGCPHACIFCVGRKMVGPRVRYRDPAGIVEEMGELSRYGFHQINLADDLFTADSGHCTRVCRQISKKGLCLSWTSFARVDTVTPDLAAELAAAGCHTLSFGVESADPEILKTARKGITPSQAVEAIGCCVEAGITPQVSFILGLPGETPETLKKTAAFADRLQQMGATFGFHLLAPFPGTEVAERAADYGIKILTDDWRMYHANRAVTETKAVPASMLDRIVIGWEKKFDQYLQELDTLRRSGRGPAETVWPLTRLEHTVVIHDLMMHRSIEENGAWENGCGQVASDSALEKLAGRIAAPPSASYDAAQIARTLRYCLSEGFLQMSQDDGTVRWAWVDTVAPEVQDCETAFKAGTDG